MYDHQQESESEEKVAQSASKTGIQWVNQNPEFQKELQLKEAIQRRPNNTGLPDHLKSGIENLSGHSMDDVKVHYNSSKPAQLNAHAYAQGNQIHLASGQEKHLPHEAWHVVQQKQGRVRATLQMKDNVNVNDDAGLEKEADVMGMRALNMKGTVPVQCAKPLPLNSVIQRMKDWEFRDFKMAFDDLKERVDFDKFKEKPYTASFHELQKFRTAMRNSDGELKVDLNQVKAQKGTSDIILKPIVEDKSKQTFGAAGSRGYIGTSIVWSGESGAADLANKYVKKSQSWDSNTRKARLAINFGINNRAEFDSAKNASAEKQVDAITKSSSGKTKNDVTTYVEGWTWGYSYGKGKLPKSNTEEVTKIIETGLLGTKQVIWMEGEAQIVTKSEVKQKFGKIRGEAGVPYGALRSKIGKNTKEIEAHLKGTNKVSDAYVHSIDADAPDFSTLKEDDEGDGWKDILDAYDEILDEGGHDVVIGGYNLTANPEEYKGKDFQYTIMSNAVDLAIRQAIHAIEPLMTYPTEPNFIIKASEYTAAETEAGSSNVWGSGAYEGRNFIDHYIKAKGATNADIHYDPLASVPTGVGGGGGRLKIDSSKKYDEDSIYGKPLADTTSKVGDKVLLDDQFIVQAQSWAGASRIAAAFRSAYKAKTGEDVTGTKDDSIAAFQPIEEMVSDLLNPDKSVKDTNIESLYHLKFNTSNSKINISKILKGVQSRLSQLEVHPLFSGTQ